MHKVPTINSSSGCPDSLPPQQPERQQQRAPPQSQAQQHRNSIGGNIIFGGDQRHLSRWQISKVMKNDIIWYISKFPLLYFIIIYCQFRSPERCHLHSQHHHRHQDDLKVKKPFLFNKVLKLSLIVCLELQNRRLWSRGRHPSSSRGRHPSPSNPRRDSEELLISRNHRAGTVGPISGEEESTW